MGLSLLDRFLTLWIVLALVVGYGLSRIPGYLEFLAMLSQGTTCYPIAAGLILMMWPPLAKVRYDRLRQVFVDVKCLALSTGFNWILGPFLMFGLALLTLKNEPDFLNGVILVGLARCIAMVVVWNELAGGDNEYAAAIVAVNSSLQLVLYSPLSYLFLSILPPLFGMQTTTLSVSFASIAISVAIYLGIPFVLGLLTWALLRPRLGNERYFSSFIPAFGKLTLFSLLFTVAIMFSLQSQSIIANPLSVVRVAVPLLVYFALMFGLSLLSSWALRIEYSKAVTLAFTAASNNFGKRMPSPPSDVAELAIAVAVATFGVKSNAAFAAVVGPLVEIPVMLALVYVAKAVKRTFDRRHHVHAVELKDVTEGD